MTTPTGADTEPSDLPDLVRGFAEMELALPAYLKAEDYDTGKIAEWFASEEERKALANSAEGYKMSILSACIDAVSDRLEIRSVEVADNPTATRRLDAVWNANNYETGSAAWLRMVCRYGDAYELIQDVSDDKSIVDVDLRAAGVSITTLNPKNCRAIYGPNDDNVPEFTVQRWRVKVSGDNRWGATVWYDDHASHWISTEEHPDDASQWQPFIEGPVSDGDVVGNVDSGEDFPYTESPIVHHRNAKPYGQPEHIRGYGMQNALLKMLFGQIGTAYQHSMGSRLIMGDSAAQLGHSSRDPMGDLYATEGSNEEALRRARPGDATLLYGIKGVHEFSHADPDVFLDPAQFYIYLIALLTRTPLHMLDLRGQIPSGESLKVANSPSDRKAKKRQTELHTCRVTWRIVAQILGIEAPKIVVNWVSPSLAAGVPVDWAELAAKEAAGVPRSRVLMEAGYGREEAEQWAAPSVEQRITLLSRVSATLAELAAAVGEPVADADTVRRMIEQLFDEASEAVDDA